VGEQLFQTQNKEGLRAVDICEQRRNYACLQTLQVVERNIAYQNAMMMRDVA